ncbi:MULTISPECIES: hypothetical protein [Geobacillus]|jgi:hypothetical protein|uniref:Uncharacterized protein n=2 Tax=Geobacillus thermodenitrificans TaxID=33940 RepID=A4IN89_GEOTN|nr:MULTISPECIES: hypothetical protein [Geobacillus]ABO66793.1 Conserved hypothetical protein [Geobacillus thermodenitrificans NG80-2]ARA96852.1 hypothetical protein GD3902_01620 [Geobacillus thermodenitrificans]ATO36123.1 hypothetical protein GTID1_02180 [Geobacillus thermodenitrificans]MED0661602.1 hypothetical protein [Geobacillus thermodenitrificans]MED3904731.1 hypothetical protein [Geobacillus thermodenitrificans]
MVRLWRKKMWMAKRAYEATIFQTPRFGEPKYRQVCRLTVTASDHHEALSILYRMFNVVDLMPKNCQARFMGTGDIVLIDEGRKGQTYYRLCSGGWKPVERQRVILTEYSKI